MIQLNRILCPVDFSDCSRHALDHAVAVARWYEAEVTVLHVFNDRPPVDIIPSLPGRSRGAPVQASLERRQEVGRELHQFALPSRVDEVDMEEMVLEAPDVATEIIVQAGVRKPDLLVVGTHGRSGFQRLLIGSVTEKVLRESDVPTMVVPRRVERVAFGPAAPFKRILCSIDFSVSALNALTYAMSLAEEADADLTVLHVIDISPELRDAADLAGFPIADVRAKAEASCRQRLEALVPDSVRAYCSVDTVVAEGRPSSEILRLAAAGRADLVVMGVHGRSAIDLLLSGSKTREVIRAAECPVLTVRGESKAAR